MASRFPGGLAVRNKKYIDTNTYVNGGSPMTETVIREMVIPISYADATSEYATNFKFNTPTIVDDVYVRVRVAEATGGTKTIKVGTATADSGNPLIYINQASVASTGILTTTSGLPITLTPAASTSPNVAPTNGLMTITGGTLTHITLTRGTTTTADLGTTGPANIYTSAGDAVNITYSVAPTGLLFFPEQGNLQHQPGAVRISWTPGSNDWAQFQGDIVVRYHFIADLTITPDDYAEIPEQGAGYL